MRHLCQPRSGNTLLQLFRFMYQHGSHLAFGAILMAMSSFGQTYFVSLYGQDLRQAFGLNDGGLSGLYAAGTVMSAVTLTRLGRMIYYITTRRFTLAVTLLLITACLLVSGAQAAWMLCAGFFLLRFCGQGLMVHTALTATARQCPLDAVKALGAIALSLSLAQALFPLAAVQINYLTSWRMELACAELRKHNLSINEIARLTGYKSVPSFSLAFKRHTGRTPRGYRNLHKNT